ncbi:MAG: class I mannose-6-phosphate isomerase [Planctomycetes bacterium]|nr:class I mannose-6-phosphate isomerase [Planctomycetota bacterium]
MNRKAETISYPLLFQPIPKVRVWGGQALARQRGLNSEEPIGESWEICDHGEDVSIITNGSLAGKDLHTIFNDFPEEVVGSGAGSHSPERFPLMLKLLDSCARLSVQVHPTDEYANQNQIGDQGKTEAWYILEADPGAYIYRGLKSPLDKAELRQAIAHGELEEHLQCIEVKAGEVYYIPAGMIHALGEGVRLAEIQQNSDTTYRLFDWDRVGLDGQPRELHIEDGVTVSQVINEVPDRCLPEALSQQGCTRERFIRSEKFGMEKLSGFGEDTQISTENKSFHILTVVTGELTVETRGGKETLTKWETCLVPAGCGEYSLRGDNATAALLFYLP